MLAKAADITPALERYLQMLVPNMDRPNRLAIQWGNLRTHSGIVGRLFSSQHMFILKLRKWEPWCRDISLNQHAVDYVKTNSSYK